MEAGRRWVIAALLTASVSAPGWAEELRLGEPPPDQLGETADGDPFVVSEGVGRIQIISFWATWCPPCMRELPVLNAIQKQVGPELMRVAAVNLKESPRRFRRARHMFRDFEIELIHDRRGELASRYGVSGIPHLFIIGPDGTLAAQHVGYGESALDDIVDEINGLLLALQTPTAEPPEDAGEDPAASQ